MSSNRTASITTSADVYKDIRSRIVDGGLSPGSRLVQRQLAAEYNTSNSPIIECIRRLEGDGLVVSIPGLGAEVREFNQQDLFFLCKLREAVDATGSALYAVNANRIQRRELEECAKRCDEALLAGDETGYGQADISLHLHIAEHSGSPLLCHFVESSYILSATVLNRMLAESEWPADIKIGEHDTLVQAANSGDPKRARNAALDHLRHGFHCVIEAFGLDDVTDVL